MIGLTQHGMPLAEAASTYTLLTVGDGLVTAVTSLLIAIAASRGDIVIDRRATFGSSRTRAI